MTRSLKLLLVVAAILAVVCGITLVTAPKARPTGAVNVTSRRLSRGVPEGEKAPSAHHLDSYEKVTVTLYIPGTEEEKSEEEASEAPEAGQGKASRCPATRVNAILGVTASAGGHGVVVTEILPDGLADQVGIQRGDSIASCDGHETTCPATLLPHIRSKKEGREVELNLLRPKAEDTGSAAVEPAPAENRAGE